MITLATLPQATEQEVFDQVAVHLLRQGKRSRKYGRCAYRGLDDFKCAAGCLISDAEYRASIESSTWKQLIAFNRVPNAHADLIADLQIVHDLTDTPYWKGHLVRLAHHYNLSTAAIDNL